MGSKKTRAAVSAVTYILISILAVICVFPFFWMLISALKPKDEIRSAVPSLLIDNPTIDNFHRVLVDNGFLTYIKNSFVVSLAATLISMIIAVLAVSISLLGIFLLLYEMYRVAQEYTRNTQLDRENQLLAMESRRYMELQTYLDNTRRLRHDFRQHLHVIAGLTETGQLEELKSYLHQYESELSEHRPSLCANAAVDALAGYYDHAAGQQSVPVEWKLALPRQLPMPEADLCTILGNLLENALHASQKLPPEQRRVQVMAQILSPAMLGLVVENRYDGMLKKQQGILRSTKHEGTGIGLVSAETVVHKYNGNLHLETEEHLFRVNVLLNL